MPVATAEPPTATVAGDAAHLRKMGESLLTDIESSDSAIIHILSSFMILDENNVADLPVPLKPRHF